MKSTSLTQLSSRAAILASLFFAAVLPQSAMAGEADLIIPSLNRPIALGLSGQWLLIGVRHADLCASQKPARAQIDARSF